MATTAHIVEYLDDLLGTGAIPDYPNARNGLQLTNSGSVSRVAAAVDFSTRTVAEASKAQADFMIVHHGMFWNGVQAIRGPVYSRLRMLITNDIAVYASHLPLDRHPLYGNNALLATKLALEPTKEFGRFQTISVGVAGLADVDTRTLLQSADAFSRGHGGSAHGTTILPGQRTRSWAICTGAGASSDTIGEACDRGIDTLIVGEGPHHTAIDAEDAGLTILYLGHYATETLGVSALAAHVSERFGVPWTFIEAPTGR